MFLMLFRKINKNKWMVLCLLIGFILAISIICAIPMFSRGMLSGVLLKDLKNAEKTKNINPGSYATNKSLDNNDSDPEKTYNNFQIISRDLYSGLGTKAYEEKTIIEASQINMIDEKDTMFDLGMDKALGAVQDIEKHIIITQGSLFSDEPSKDGCFDAMVSEDTLKNLDIQFGEIIYIKDLDLDSKNKIKIRICGIYKDKYPKRNGNNEGNIILISNTAFKKYILRKKALPVNQIYFYEYFDYNQLAYKDIENILSDFDSQTKTAKKYNITINFPDYDILNSYINKEIQLKSIMMVLEVPIIILIILYIFMISDLIAEQEKSEIAVLKSRGAGTAGICITYLMQVLVISAVALLIGPLSGALICRTLGVCNGFLEFADRSSIDVQLTGSEYKNSLIAVAVFIVITMLPIIISTRTTIVQYRQSKSKKRQPIWEKYFIDILLLGIAGYGYYNYSQRQNYIKISGLSSGEVPIDPIIYLIAAFFIIGAALVFLRIYPYIIKFIFFLGKNRWSEAAYASLIDVGRSKGREQFLMVFLIFTISLGIFDMRAADIINRDIECNQRYLLGSDMMLQAWWYYSDNTVADPDKATESDKVMHTYIEPAFSDYQHLNGVDKATKVFTTDLGEYILSDKPAGGVRIMGIIPYEFAQTADFQENLLPVHWYNYCNALTKDKNGILISKSLADKCDFKLGDKITYCWEGSPEFVGTVYAIVDFWPSYNPKGENDLIVANLSMLQENVPVQPYQVWIRKKSPDSTKDIYNSIIAKKLAIKQAKDVDQLIEEAKSEPMIQGTNGAMTLGFIVTMVITALGFIIYWTLSIRGKMLRFGLLRAMGLPFKKIISMIFYEQFLISGVSIVIGIILGKISADKFMNMMNLASDAQAIPSSLVVYGGSYVRLVIIIIFTFAVGILSLIVYISNIKMDQAVKLGED